MKNSIVTKTICSLLFGLTATVSLVAAADDYNETRVTTSAEGIRTATVSYADLDLSDAHGREVLQYRISAAAHKVCGSSQRSDAGSLAQASKNRNCYNGAMNDAMRSLSEGQVAVASR